MEDLNLQVESLFSLDAEALQTQLLARFYAWRDSRPAANIYVLLDQSHPVAGHDDLHRTQLLKRKVSRHVEPVSRPDLQGDPDTAPLLVQLYVAGEHGYADESLIELTLRHSLKRCRSVNGAYVAGWICSDAHPKPLADWIAKSGVVFVQHEGRQRFMPFFEPFRMALLADDETSSPFLTRWLGPISQWLLLDSAGSLRQISPRSAPTPGVLQTLGHKHFASQSRVGVARFVVMALEKSGVLITQKPESRIDAVIAEAQASGLAEVEDIVFYALNSFTVGAGWASHPRAAAAIAKTASDRSVRLADELLGLSEEALNDIARGAPKQT